MVAHLLRLKLTLLRNGLRRSAWQVVFLSKEASHSRLNSQHLPESGCRCAARDSARLAFSGQRIASRPGHNRRGVKN